MSHYQAVCYMNGNLVEGPNGISYDRQPIGAVIIPQNCAYDTLVVKLCKRFRINTAQYVLKISHRYPILLLNGDISYVLIPIECEDGMESLHGFPLPNIELYLDLESVNVTPTIPTHYTQTTHMHQDIDLNAGPSGSRNMATDEYDRFSPVEEPINDDPDPADVDESDNIVFDDGESENDDEEEEEEEEAHYEQINYQVDNSQQQYYDAGPSMAGTSAPSYVVPSNYTDLDWGAIAENAPMTAWMQDTESARDAKQEFRTGMCFRDKKSNHQCSESIFH